MGLVQPTDDDFRVCELVLADLVELQQDAEQHGFSTRWTSVSALLEHVDDQPILLMTFLREQRQETLRTYRCLVRFEPKVPSEAELVVATVDVAPDKLRAFPAAGGDHGKLAADLIALPVVFKP